MCILWKESLTLGWLTTVSASKRTSTEKKKKIIFNVQDSFTPSSSYSSQRNCLKTWKINVERINASSKISFLLFFFFSFIFLYPKSASTLLTFYGLIINKFFFNGWLDVDGSSDGNTASKSNYNNSNYYKRQLFNF